MAYTVSEFAEMVRRMSSQGRTSDPYSSLDDESIVKAYIQSHPEYESWVDFTPPKITPIGSPTDLPVEAPFASAPAATSTDAGFRASTGAPTQSEFLKGIGAEPVTPLAPEEKPFVGTKTEVTPPRGAPAQPKKTEYFEPVDVTTPRKDDRPPPHRGEEINYASPGPSPFQETVSTIVEPAKMAKNVFDASFSKNLAGYSGDPRESWDAETKAEFEKAAEAGAELAKQSGVTEEDASWTGWSPSLKGSFYKKISSLPKEKQGEAIDQLRAYLISSRVDQRKAKTEEIMSKAIYEMDDVKAAISALDVVEGENGLSTFKKAVESGYVGFTGDVFLGLSVMAENQKLVDKVSTLRDEYSKTVADVAASKREDIENSSGVAKAANILKEWVDGAGSMAGGMAPGLILGAIPIVGAPARVGLWYMQGYGEIAGDLVKEGVDLKTINKVAPIGAAGYTVIQEIQTRQALGVLKGAMSKTTIADGAIKAKVRSFVTDIAKKVASTRSTIPGEIAAKTAGAAVETGKQVLEEALQRGATELAQEGARALDGAKMQHDWTTIRSAVFGTKEKPGIVGDMGEEASGAFGPMALFSLLGLGMGTYRSIKDYSDIQAVVKAYEAAAVEERAEILKNPDVWHAKNVEGKSDADLANEPVETPSAPVEDQVPVSEPVPTEAETAAMDRAEAVVSDDEEKAAGSFNAKVSVAMNELASLGLTPTQEQAEAITLKMSMHPITSLPSEMHLQKAKMQPVKEGFVRLYGYMDGDYFKLWNDKYGHDFGDAVMKKLQGAANAEASKQGVQHFHIKGDEGAFTVDLPESAVSNIDKRLNAIKKAVNSTEIETPDGKKLPLGITIGVATSLSAADKVMVEGKAAGKKNSILIDNQLKNDYNISETVGEDLGPVYEKAGLKLPRKEQKNEQSKTIDSGRGVGGADSKGVGGRVDSGAARQVEADPEGKASGTRQEGNRSVNGQQSKTTDSAGRVDGRPVSIVDREDNGPRSGKGSAKQAKDGNSGSRQESAGGVKPPSVVGKGASNATEQGMGGSQKRDSQATPEGDVATGAAQGAPERGRQPGEVPASAQQDLDSLLGAASKSEGREYIAKAVPAKSSTQKAAEAYAKEKLGLEVVFFRGLKDANRIGGFFSQRNAKRIYVNTQAKSPARAVVMHEAVHSFATKSPEEFKSLMNTVRDLLKGESAKKFYSMLVYQGGGGKAGVEYADSVLKEGIFGEEFLAELLTGEMTKVGAFFDSLIEKAPEAFRKLLEVLRDVIEKLFGKSEIGRKRMPAAGYLDGKVVADIRKLIEDNLEKTKDAVAPGERTGAVAKQIQKVSNATINRFLGGDSVITVEAAPSTKLNLSPWIHTAPQDVKVHYTREMMIPAYDMFSNRYIPILPTSGSRGPLTRVLVTAGAWEGLSNPMLMLNVDKFSEVYQTVAVDLNPADYIEHDDYHNDVLCAMLGYAYSQDGVGWHSPFASMSEEALNSIEFRMETGRTLTPEMSVRIQQLLSEMPQDLKDKGLSWCNPVGCSRGWRFINWSSASNDEFKDVMIDITDRATKEFGVDVEAVRFASKSNLVSNDWKENPDGGSYKSIYSPDFGPDLPQWKRDVLNRISKSETGHENPEYFGKFAESLKRDVDRQRERLDAEYGPKVVFVPKTAEAIMESLPAAGAAPINLTSKIFSLPMLAGKTMVNRQEIDGALKQQGIKPFEKEILNYILNKNHEGEKRISVEALKREVDAYYMPLEKIITTTYADYGVDAVYDAKGIYNDKGESLGYERVLPETVLFNAPVDHGIGGHFGGDFDRGDKFLYNPRELSNGSWVAIREDAPQLTAENYTEYVGTAGSKEVVLQWIQNKNFGGKGSNKGLFAHARLFTVLNRIANGFKKNDKKELVPVDMEQYKATFVSEIQSDVWQKQDIEDIFTEKKRGISSTFTGLQKTLYNSYTTQASELLVKMFNDSFTKTELSAIFGDAKSFLPHPEEVQAKLDSIVSRYKTFLDSFISEDSPMLGEIDAETHEESIAFWVRRGLINSAAISSPAQFLDRYIDDTISIPGHAQAVVSGGIDLSMGTDFVVNQVANGNYSDLFALYAGAKAIRNARRLREKEREAIKNSPEMSMEKQFLSFKKNWHERIIREVIKKAALDGSRKILFPSPFTVAKIEGFISDETGVMPYEILEQDPANGRRTYDRRGEDLVPGALIVHAEHKYIVVSTRDDKIWAAPEDDVIVYNLQEQVEADRQSYLEDGLLFDDIKNYFESYVPDLSAEALADIELESRGKEFWRNSRAHSLLHDVVYDNEEEVKDLDKMVDLIVKTHGKELVEIKIDEEYSADNIRYGGEFGRTTSFGDGTANDGDDLIFVFDNTSTETFMQPSEYAIKHGADEDSFSVDQSNLQDEHKTVLKRYEKDILDYLRKNRKDLKKVKIQDAYWYETEITNDDVNNPVLAYQRQYIRGEHSPKGKDDLMRPAYAGGGNGIMFGFGRYVIDTTAPDAKDTAKWYALGPIRRKHGIWPIFDGDEEIKYGDEIGGPGTELAVLAYYDTPNAEIAKIAETMLAKIKAGARFGKEYIPEVEKILKAAKNGTLRRLHESYGLILEPTLRDEEMLFMPWNSGPSLQALNAVQAQMIRMDLNDYYVAAINKLSKMPMPAWDEDGLSGANVYRSVAYAIGNRGVKPKQEGDFMFPETPKVDFEDMVDPFRVVARESMLQASKALREAGITGMTARTKSPATNTDTEYTVFFDDKDLQVKDVIAFMRDRAFGMPEFKEFFGDWENDKDNSSKVLDVNGQPAVMYHASTKVFKKADPSKGVPESDLGRGFYLSSEPDDASKNYAGIGPDQKNKIERVTERLASDLEVEYGTSEYKKLKRNVRRKLYGGRENVMPGFVNLRNPFIIGKSSIQPETFLTYEFGQDSDGETDYASGAEGTLVPLLNALESAAYNASADASRLIERLTTEAIDNGGMRAATFYEEVVGDEYLNETAIDSQGRFIHREIMRQAIEDAGYDGIIDYTVYGKFGPRRVGSGYQIPGMPGLYEDTFHVVTFKPNQVKSVFSRSFKKDDDRLAFQRQSPGRLTEAKFYGNYYVHKLIRGAGDMDSILENGFKSMSPNVMPAYRGGEPRNIIQKAYAPMAGDVIMFVPKDQVQLSRSKVKDGYKPSREDFATVEYDYQPMYELYQKTHPNIAFQKQRKPKSAINQMVSLPVDLVGSKYKIEELSDYINKARGTLLKIRNEETVLLRAKSQMAIDQYVSYVNQVREQASLATKEEKLKIETAKIAMRNEVKRLLGNYAKQVGYVGGLDDLVDKVKTPVSLNSVLESIDYRVRHEARKALERRMNSYMNGIRMRIKKLKSPKKTSTFDPDLSARLISMFDRLQGLTPRMNIDEIDDKIQNGQPVNDLEAKFKSIYDRMMKEPDAILSAEETAFVFKNFQPSMDEMTNEELLRSFEEIKSVYLTGKSIRGNKLDKMVRDESKKLSAIIAQVRANVSEKAYEKADKALTEQRTKTALEQVAYIAKEYGWSYMRPELISEWMTGHFPLLGQKMGAVTRFIFDPLLRASYRETEGLSLHQGAVSDMFKVIDLKSMFDQKIVSHRTNARTGSRIEAPISMNQAMFVYANSKNEDNRRHLYGTGFSDEDIEEVVSQVPVEAQNAVDNLLKFYDNVMWPRLNKVFRSVYGVEMPRAYNYFPIMRLDRKSEENPIIMDLMQRFSTRPQAVDKSRVKSRVKSKAAFRDMDFMKTVYSAMAQNEHYIAFEEAANDVRRLLANSEVRNVMKLRSESAYNALWSWMQDAIAGKVPQVQNSPLDMAADYLRKNYGVFALGFNPRVIAKQLASIPPALGFVKPGLIGKYAAMWIAKGREMERNAMSMSPFLTARKGEIDHFLKEMMDSRKMKDLFGIGAKGDAIRKLSMEGIQSFDMASCTILWWAKFDEIFYKTGSKDLAIKAADLVVRRTQSTGNLVTLPGAFRTHGIVASFTQFQNQVNQNVNALAMIGMGARSKTVSPETMRTAAAGTFFGTIAASYWIYLVDNAFKVSRFVDDPEGGLLWLANSIFGTFAFIGDGVDYLGRVMRNKVREATGRKAIPLMDYDPSPSMIDFAKTFVRATESTIEAVGAGVSGDTEKAAIKAGKAASDAAQVVGAVTGLPVSFTTRLVKGGFRIAEGDPWYSLMYPKQATQDLSLRAAMVDRASKPKGWEDRLLMLAYYNQLDGLGKSKFLNDMKKAGDKEPAKTIRELNDWLTGEQKKEPKFDAAKSKFGYSYLKSGGMKNRFARRREDAYEEMTAQERVTWKTSEKIKAIDAEEKKFNESWMNYMKATGKAKK